MRSPTTESMPRTGQPAFRLVGAVQRAFSVLDALAEADTELGTNEIARRTGINASSVSRLLATLVAGGLVEHVPDSGRYRLGLRLLQLGNVWWPKARSTLPVAVACATLGLPSRATPCTDDGL